ncbi:hypothetical protein WJX74_002170 [Apatococcus lobatus]|uniref:Uncharacterized protein n=1 Tax=Apatococcus lobatus TaxID=904363 RepID=A0AAW1S314_9CHLO
MESRTRFVLVASFSLLLTSASAQFAPAPGPGGMPEPGLIGAAPAMPTGSQTPNQPSPNSVQPGLTNQQPGLAFAPGPGGPTHVQTQPQVTPQVTASPSPVNPSPSPTSPPPPPPMVTLAPPTRTTTVAFVSRLELDNVNTFDTVIPPANVNPKGLTYAGLWCDTLTTKYPGSTCTATATQGSVNVQSVMGFPVVASNPNAAATQAAALTSNLQQIAANPSLANDLIPVAAFGGIQVSGIQVTAASPAMAPAMSPRRAPSAAPAPPPSFSFTVRLNFATVEQFNPLRDAWCNQLVRAYPSATCRVTNVYLGSLYVETAMTFPQGDSSANVMLEELRNPSENSALFSDPQFGTVTVTSAGGQTVAPASVPPPSPPTTKHHLSGGKIAGAVIGSIAGAAILGGCGFAGYKYYHTRRAYQPAV